MDIPSFETDEGRYLAKSLGEPLIKGLTEVASVKPRDPVAFLASFLYNLPEDERPRLKTQESKVSDEFSDASDEQFGQETEQANNDMNNGIGGQMPIDVVTVDANNDGDLDAPETAPTSETRDEHGQSVLHFAAARSHSRNAFFTLINDSDISLAYRDELYRTARDVSIQANIPENTIEIDRYIVSIAARGNTEKLMNLLVEGYDHIVDILDDEGIPIMEVVTQRQQEQVATLLASIPDFESSRESLHQAVRRGDIASVRNTLSSPDSGKMMARAKNAFGRNALHISVLIENEEIVEFICLKFPELLRSGDNLERTALHYAMGLSKIEALSRILIKAGAKRVLKDLKGRQPTYYFMNKSDILRLKEEEEVY